MTHLKMVIEIHDGKVTIERADDLNNSATQGSLNDASEEIEENTGPKMASEAQKFTLKQNGYTEDQVEIMTAREAFLKIKSIKEKGG